MKQFIIQLFTALVLTLAGVTWFHAQSTAQAADTTPSEQTNEHQSENPSAAHEADEPSDDQTSDAKQHAADMKLFNTESADGSAGDATDKTAKTSKVKPVPTLKNAVPPSVDAAADAKSKQAAALPLPSTSTDANEESDSGAQQPGNASSNTSADSVIEDASKSVDSPKTPNLLPARKPWSFYKPLVERNIFTRQQPRKTTTTDKPSTAPSTPVSPAAPTAPNWVLTGIVIHEQGNYAFFENSQTNVTLRISAGQSLGESHIKTIEQDHVLLGGSESNSDQRVSIGSTLDGSAVSLGNSSSGSIFGESTPDTAAAEGSSPAANDPSKMSVIERMRARRQREGSK